jgi:hypothetical protein
MRNNIHLGISFLISTGLIFFTSLLLNPNARATSKNSEQISNWLDDTFNITEASSQIYRASIPKQDPRRKKLESEKVKNDIKKNVQLKINKKLESEFTESELKYLNDLFHHQLLVKFEKFRQNLYQADAVKEIVEKK